MKIFKHSHWYWFTIWSHIGHVTETRISTTMVTPGGFIHIRWDKGYAYWSNDATPPVRNRESKDYNAGFWIKRPSCVEDCP